MCKIKDDDIDEGLSMPSELDPLDNLCSILGNDSLSKIALDQFNGDKERSSWFIKNSIKSKKRGMNLFFILMQYGHYYNFGIKEIDEYDVTKHENVEEPIAIFDSIYDTWIEQDRSLIPLDQAEQRKVFFVCSNPDFIWFDLETTRSTEEMIAMSHCGTDPAGDTMISLREKTYSEEGELLGYNARVTLTYNFEDKCVIQIKGRRNTKVPVEYRKYFLELVESGIVNKMDQKTSYNPVNDIYWSDFPDDLDRLINANPGMMEDEFINSYVNGEKNRIIHLSRTNKIVFDEEGEINFIYNLGNMWGFSTGNKFLLRESDGSTTPINISGMLSFIVNFPTRDCTQIVDSSGSILETDPFNFDELMLGNVKDIIVKEIKDVYRVMQEEV